MAAPGVELIVAARADAVVPALVIGLGGVWTEMLGDVAIVPLPASAARILTAASLVARRAAANGRRGGPLRPTWRCGAACRTGRRGPLEESLDLIELNPVFVGPEGAVAVDAIARRRVGVASEAVAVP